MLLEQLQELHSGHQTFQLMTERQISPDITFIISTLVDEKSVQNQTFPLLKPI